MDKVCVDEAKLCDGLNSCGDFSDEICQLTNENDQEITPKTDNRNAPKVDDNKPKEEKLLCIVKKVCLNRTMLLYTLAALFCLITLSIVALFFVVSRRHRNRGASSSSHAVAEFFKKKSLKIKKKMLKINMMRNGGSFANQMPSTTIIAISKTDDTQ